MGRTQIDDLKIRAMTPEDFAVAIDWAAAEGWNPGLGDAQCFRPVDPQGFLIGEWEGRPAAIISTVNYDTQFSFLGFYIVRPDLRGRGFGLRLWAAGLAHAGRRSVGLDGVVAQQDNYRKSGFVYSHRNVRYAGVVADVGERQTGEIVTLSQIPFGKIVAEDARVYPVTRELFWCTWLDAADHRGAALIRDGDLAAWGVIRPCRTGRRIGPLVAADREGAAAVLSALAASGTGEIFIDVPEPNAPAVALAQDCGLKPVFETARMYKGRVRSVELDRVFGVTSLELG